MSFTPKQSLITTVDLNADAEAASRVEIEESPKVDGIAIQRLAWSAVSTNSPVTPELSFGITLDLNLYSRPGSRTIELFKSLWDENVTPALIADGEVICCFEPEDEILREIITTASRPEVQPGIHTRRIESPAGCTGNTLIYSDSLNLCDQGLIIAALYDDGRDLNFNASETLKSLVSQLQQDHSSLLSILGKTLRRPRAYRALIDINAGKCLWSGPNDSKKSTDQSAPVDWSALAERFKPNSHIDGRSPAASGRPLALVTSLAREHVEDVDDSPIYSSDYRIPDSVSRRLGRVISIPDSQPEDSGHKAFALPHTRRRHLAYSAEASRLVSSGGDESAEQRTKKSDSKKSKKRSKPDSSSRKKDDALSPTREAQSKTALRIALHRLPKGGKLKLSAVNHDGEMQFDSFDITGERLVSVSVKDPEKGNK